jgi:uncharacterized protein
MKINNEFTVGVPVQQAWDVMLDLERIAPCLPGAAIQEAEGDEYRGTMKVKIGPITANYKGTARFEETDEENRRAVLNATGRDARGQGTASATIVSTLQEEGDSTRVKVETDMKLTGRAAQFGRGIAQDVATKMLGQFANCLEREISGGPAEEGAAAAQTEPSGDGAASQDEAPTAPAGSVGGTAGRIISSEDPRVMAGGPVEGAVISDGAQETPTTEQTRAEQPPPRREPEEQEAFDLGAASQEAILKRVGPILAGLGLLAILIWLIRR